MIAQFKLTSKYLRLSPRKLQRVLRMIRGKSCEEAYVLLAYMPYSACLPVLKLFTAFSSKICYPPYLHVKHLFIKRAIVDQGPTLSRFRPCARGRIVKLRKRTSHLTLEFESCIKTFNHNKRNNV